MAGAQAWKGQRQHAHHLAVDDDDDGLLLVAQRDGFTPTVKFKI